MSPVAFSLELLLAVLLVATLGFGFRLEGKLRALRESQATFVKAMGELDGAAARAQTGLEMLRQATEEAQGVLGPRIEAARAAASVLEQLTSDAELAARRAEVAAESVQASARTLARVVPTARSAGPAPRPTAPVPAPEPEASPRAPPDFAAMLAAATPRQPLPGTSEPQPQARRGAVASRLREAAALLRGG
ncbi:MAG: hypothetical protein KY449_02425 [Proteobacteria bacterium]|nr:hypothetical protein [Pseudomonadota bacterium]